ncbi:MAG TPA: tyrosine-type recombinase/integrase [Gemmatimonadales bacterium]|nr:tyrosine-type recombinase/integrase [Gemmatimonadales bacterium]
MARHAEGWKLRPDKRRGGLYYVVFRRDGRRYMLATGERDLGEATLAAEALYASVVHGRRRPGVPVAQLLSAPGAQLDTLAAKWLADMEAQLDHTTCRQYEMYVASHWQPYFKTIDRMTALSIEDYWRARLRKVQRRTVLKELSALRGLLSWCADRGHIAEAPTVKSPPARAHGTPDTKRPHKKQPVELEEHEVEAILAALPERSEGSPGRLGFVVRARFEVAWETALRPATLNELRVPSDYARGRTSLIIRDEVDKARFGRELPLSDRAREALDRVCPEVGLIFGCHYELGKLLKQAAADAKLPKEKADAVSAYDLRHGRLTLLAERSPNLVGVAYLAGHKQVTTTNRYLRTSKRAAEEVLAAAVAGRPGGPPTPPDDRQANRSTPPEAMPSAEPIGMPHTETCSSGALRGTGWHSESEEVQADQHACARSGSCGVTPVRVRVSPFAPGLS